MAARSRCRSPFHDRENLGGGHNLTGKIWGVACRDFSVAFLQIHITRSCKSMLRVLADPYHSVLQIHIFRSCKSKKKTAATFLKAGKGRAEQVRFWFEVVNSKTMF